MSLIETMLKKGGLAPLPKSSVPVATATLATVATQRQSPRPKVARIATVAVATPKTDPTPEAESLESWQDWQSANPLPGNVTMTEGETSDIRGWLAFIGEVDPLAVVDALSLCERFPDTKAHFLREAKTTKSLQAIATRAALEAAQEHALILNQDKLRTTNANVTALAEAFYNHLFGPGVATGCCWAPRNRYCAEGLKLRDTYYNAAKAAGKMT